MNLNQYASRPLTLTGDSPCFADRAQMFIQVGCSLPLVDLVQRQERGLVLGCAAVFIALFVVNYLDYIKKVQQNNYVEWDVKTITAGDFTIEFDLDPTFFKDFMEKEMENYTNKCAEEGKFFQSRVQCFQDWIQKEMERRISELPDLGFEDEPVEHVKVAVTTLAFKNADVINLLRQRGYAIKTENWAQ